MHACQEAILGIATINVQDLKARMMLRYFTPTRVVQEELVNKISKCLAAGENKAGSNPLAIAIVPTAIEVQFLGGSYDTYRQTPTLSPATIADDPNAKLYVLSGCHRMLAARKAMRSLDKRIEVLRKKVKELEDVPSNDPGDDGTQNDGDPAKTRETVEIIAKEVEVLKELQESAQVWPAWFYDYGRF